MTALRRTILLAAVLIAAVSPALASGEVTPPRDWSDELIHVASTIPIQEGGRIKPLSTFVRFRLLSMNGRTTAKSAKDWSVEWKRSSMEWLLDTLFFPEVADRYPVFLVRTTEVIDALRLPHEGKRKSDRYSYEELLPGRDRLAQLGGEYSRIEAKDRSFVEGQIVDLATNVFLYEQVRDGLEFARHPLPVKGSPGLAAMFPGPNDGRLSVVLGKSAALLGAIRVLQQDAGGADPEKRQAEFGAMSDLLNAMRSATARAHGLTIFPPADVGEKEWRSPPDLVIVALTKGEDVRWEAGLLGRLEEAVSARNDPDALLGHLTAVRDAIAERAESRGEYGKIELEVTYYSLGLFHWSLGFFVMAFVVLALSWLVPRGRIRTTVADWIVISLIVAALVPLIAAITMRCMIRGRPPVSTLYETILFITATGSLTALVLEFIIRRRVALAFAAILGSVGLFLAMRYEAKEGTDTMPSLVAVLDTNFWLATHVTTVTLGYAAGLLAAAIAHVYVLGKLFGLGKGQVDFYRGVTRMVYGVICFGLFFSVVGTILGGIWANYSWGRFWGWDPKENGALMIVLWELALIHGRLGGYLKQLGVNLAAIFGGIVVVFSWWGVNLLGVGLHSYGFTSGILVNVLIFCGIEGLVLLCGVVVFVLERTRPIEGQA